MIALQPGTAFIVLDFNMWPFSGEGCCFADVHLESLGWGCTKHMIHGKLTELLIMYNESLIVAVIM